jgi:hypothetical protein
MMSLPITWRGAVRVVMSALCGSLLLACAKGTAAPESAADEQSDEKSPESKKVDVEALLAREQEKEWKRAEVVDPGGKWQASIESASPPEVTQQEGFVMIQADLGQGEPLSCFVYDEPIDAAAAISTVLAQAAKNVEVKKALPYALAVVEHEPALFVRAVYHTQVEGGLGLGDLKVMALPRLTNPTVCALDLPGYPDTFMRMSAGLAGSFQWKSPPPVPQRREIWAVSVNDVPVGFDSWSLVRDEKGTLQSVSLMSMLLPVSETELRALDNAKSSRIRPDGRILEGRWIKTVGGQAFLDIELSSKGATYTYAGQVKGEKVEGKVQAKGGLVGTLGVAKRLQKLAAKGEAAKFEMQEYQPGLDPTKATTVAYAYAPGSGGGEAKATVGDKTVTFGLDSSGLPNLVSHAMGGNQLVLKRVDTLGEL